MCSIASLIRMMASSRGSTPESAKKQVWSTVFVRPGSPASRATRVASIANTLMPLASTCFCTVSGSASQTSSGGSGQSRRSVAPSAARPSTSIVESKPNWWQPTKLAPVTRYGASIGSSPKRRCETVWEPDFLESYTK